MVLVSEVCLLYPVANRARIRDWLDPHGPHTIFGLEKLTIPLVSGGLKVALGLGLADLARAVVVAVNGCSRPVDGAESVGVAHELFIASHPFTCKRKGNFSFSLLES